MVSQRRLALVVWTLATWLAQFAPYASLGQLPAPQTIALQTKDGVQLKVTYFPSKQAKGSPQAKQVTPIVLLHDFKETRSGFASLAQRLQGAGEGERDRPSFAVLSVDLRAHGNSTKQLLVDGSQIDLDAAKVNRDELLAMSTLDMEAVRGLLVVKNDAGELNLNKLCIVGAGMGASVAVVWAAQDWAAPALAVGKQGQDVKGMVLVSPRWTFKGLSLQAPMRFRPLKQFVAWMLVYGDQDPRVKADIVRIERQLTPFHPENKDPGPAPPTGLSIVGLPSKLQGGSLLANAGPSIEDQIVRFLTDNVAKTDQPWFTRLNLVP